MHHHELRVLLTSNRVVHASPVQHDTYCVELSRIEGGEHVQLDACVLPPRREGLGGARLLGLSNEEHVIFHGFSGQSSEHFNVLKVGEDRLKLLHTEEDAPGYFTNFLLHHHILYWTRPQETGSFSSYLWQEGDWQEYFPPDESERIDERGFYFLKYMDLGSLDLETLEVRRQELFIRFSRGYLESLPGPLTHEDWLNAPLTISEDRLHVILPWGVEDVQCPLEGGTALNIYFE